MDIHCIYIGRRRQAREKQDLPRQALEGILRSCHALAATMISNKPSLHPAMLAAALLVVAACASFATRTVEDYDRGQTPQPQFVKDGEACARQAEADQRKFGIGGDIDPTHATYNRMYDACMRASGYRRKTEP